MPQMSTYREPKPPPRLQGQNPQHHPSQHQSHGADEHPSRHRIGTLQGHLVAASGEFVGTFMFLYFSFSCQIMLSNQASERSLLNGGPSSQQNVFTALVYGFSLLVNAWAFYRISGGLFNPAVRILLLISCSPMWS